MWWLRCKVTAVAGLLTACSQEEAARFTADWEEAGRALAGREEKRAAALDSLETEFTLLGATAVEDRLQPGTVLHATAS